MDFSPPDDCVGPVPGMANASWKLVSRARLVPAGSLSCVEDGRSETVCSASCYAFLF